MALGKTSVLIVAVAGLALGGFLFVRFNQTVQAPMKLATDFAQGSSVVRSALGEPLQFGRLPIAKVRGSNAHLGIRVTGSRGQGSLIEWAQQTAGQWKLCSLTLHTNSDDADTILLSGTTSSCAREP
jgi:Cytochrome oxidase complex assembly protein 1